MNETCIYSIPVDAEGNTPASSSIPFQFSQRDCTIATSSDPMENFPESFSLLAGAFLMFGIFVFLAFYLKNR